MSEVKGFVAPGFERVAELVGTGGTRDVGGKPRSFGLGDGGGAFAAYLGGECIVDVWAGDAAPGRPWQEDTKAVVMLYDRGLLDLRAPVVEYWPEFGAAGKEHTLVRHLLSHQAGAIALPGADELLSWDGRGWSDTVTLAAAVASGAPEWEPGTRHGYHGVTFGWLVGELVRRLSGRSLGAFLHQEVAVPLGADCRIGTPAAEHAQVAPVLEWTQSTGSPRTIDPATRAGRSVLAGAAGNLFTDEHGTPRFARFMNTPAVLSAEFGSIGATSSARGLARVYGALAHGEALVSRESVERVRTEEVCGRDAVMAVPTRWAVGYSLEPPALHGDLPPQHGPSAAAFGHMGAGGQVAFADPAHGLGVAFVRNHLENQAMPLMGACLTEALYGVLDARGRTRKGS